MAFTAVLIAVLSMVARRWLVMEHRRDPHRGAVDAAHPGSRPPAHSLITTIKRRRPSGDYDVSVVWSVLDHAVKASRARIRVWDTFKSDHNSLHMEATFCTVILLRDMCYLSEFAAGHSSPGWTNSTSRKPAQLM
jgi:hypothetical protein